VYKSCFLITVSSHLVSLLMPRRERGFKIVDRETIDSQSTDRSTRELPSVTTRALLYSHALSLGNNTLGFLFDSESRMFPMKSYSLSLPHTPADPTSRMIDLVISSILRSRTHTLRDSLRRSILLLRSNLHYLARLRPLHSSSRTRRFTPNET